MNSQFRDYVFGRAFTLHLRETQIRALADLCAKGDQEGFIFDGRASGALLSRGLIAWGSDKGEKFACRYRPTRAGMLVYDLLVEAGEAEALEAKRRAALDAEHEAHQREWDDRYEKALQIKRKEPTNG